MKIDTKKQGLLIFLLIAIVLVLIIVYIQNSEDKITEQVFVPILTTPVSIGYIQGFNHDLGYGYDSPENWTMRSGPEYFHIDGGILNVEQFVDEPEGTTITVIVKTSIWKNLDEAKTVISDAYHEDILNERMIEVNGIEGYELTRESSPTKFKMVIFYVNGRIYEFDYGADENLYDASESIFDHVVNSFNIEYK